MDNINRDWMVLLDKCLENRIQANVFAALVTQLHAKSPLPGRKLAALLLRPRSANLISIDPRIPVYLEQLLALQKVDASDVLASTFQYSTDRLPKTGNEDAQKGAQWNNPPELEEIIFHRLHKVFASDERPVDNSEGIRTLIVVTRWMQAMVTSHTSNTMIQAMAGIQAQPQQHLINVREGLGMLIVGIIENQKMLRILENPKGKEIRKVFVQSLSSFIPFLNHNSGGSNTSLSLAQRLEMSQKQHDFYNKLSPADGETNQNNPGLDVAALQLDAVMDLPLVNTRAGLYVFLNSLLIARPLTDDFMIINYLHSRYKLEPQNMATDLVTASFDILANALYRSEPPQNLYNLKSFLINKIPLLLLQISGSIFPMTLEMCISQALSHVDSNAFPAFSQGFDDIMGNNSSLADVRQDFLNACALHGLIASNTVERLLGEAPMQGPPENKYDRNELLKQCKNNFDKVSVLIDELENLDGNAGAIALAVTNFISHLCDTQMTMYLKQISCLIFKKPRAMDILLQFTSPASILQPLCQFLDEWHYDSDQGECQPVYDEFGAVLVLVMAFVRRYDLSYQDIGLAHGSFVAQFIQRGHHSRTPDDLTSEQEKSLGNWLKGLYDADKEGLSNDVFASCRPQDFYLIVPTLFRQTVLACSLGVFSFETVKGGLEYLKETFLLPALIGGLSWMASYALKNHSDLGAMIKIFNELILSTPTAGDAQSMHSTILAMVSNRLEKAFRSLQRRDPSRTTIEPLLQAIKGNSHYERSAFCSLQEVEQWTNAPHSTLNTALRHTLQQLSQWANTSAIQPNPPSYTHRQIYASVNMLGTNKALHTILEEVKAQTEAGNGAAALDIGISVICAPTVTDSPISINWASSPIPSPPTPRTRMNLREMLKQEADSAPALLATDPLLAETIIRLHRRVETHISSLTDAAALQAGGGSGGVGGPSIMHDGQPSIPDDINKAIDDAAAASIVDDISNMDNKALQRSMDELVNTDNLDLVGLGLGSASGSGSGPNKANMSSNGSANATAGVEPATDLQNTLVDNSLPGLDLSDMNTMDMGMEMEMQMDMGMGMGMDLQLDLDMSMDMDMGTGSGNGNGNGNGNSNGNAAAGGDDDWGLDFDNM
ncbi:mediator complex subunit [Coniothyrium glycines]